MYLKRRVLVPEVQSTCTLNALPVTALPCLVLVPGVRGQKLMLAVVWIGATGTNVASLTDEDCILDCPEPIQLT